MPNPAGFSRHPSIPRTPGDASHDGRKPMTSSRTVYNRLIRMLSFSLANTFRIAAAFRTKSDRFFCENDLARPFLTDRSVYFRSQNGYKPEHTGMGSIFQAKNSPRFQPNTKRNTHIYTSNTGSVQAGLMFSAENTKSKTCILQNNIVC